MSKSAELFSSTNSGISWKSAKSQIPASRTIWNYLMKTRLLSFVTLAAVVILLWRSFRGTAGDLQRFYCHGPAKSPLQMSTLERNAWVAGLKTQVLFNNHEPIEINSSTIQHIDLNKAESVESSASTGDRVLLLTPLKDAAFHLELYFELLNQLTYPHHLIDVAFLVSDSSDDTLAIVSKEAERTQKNSESLPFRSITIVEKNFGSVLSQDVDSRHGFQAQGPRRKMMAKARNYLLNSALKPEHKWVYWRDADIVECPKTVLQDFIKHGRDVLTANVWFHRYDAKGKDVEGRYDYNAWQESETGLKIAASLDKDVILAEGYPEAFVTKRTYMCLMGDKNGDADEEIPLDGIGGVNVLVKAEVHRAGINFPCYAFENQAETEGFAKMAKRAGYGVYGLPNYVVWHIDTQDLGPK